MRHSTFQSCAQELMKDLDTDSMSFEPLPKSLENVLPACWIVCLIVVGISSLWVEAWLILSKHVLHM